MIDFSKYNKGLRMYAALFNLNPDVFNTERFVDIEIVGDYSIYLYYNGIFNDSKITYLLTTNQYFYNNQFRTYKDKSYYAFYYKIIDEKDSNAEIYKSLYILGDKICMQHSIIPEKFYVHMCIIWKKYLDNSFYDLF